jgi:thymidylate synthase
MNNLDKNYQNLLFDIITNGEVKKDRTGTGTLSVFGRQIRHNMLDGYPLLTTKKMAFNVMVVELLWFLRGDTNIKYLVENGCNIWNGDAFKIYLSKTNEYKGNWPDTMEEYIERIKMDDEFAKKWGELGPIYGKQWRDWKTEVAIPVTGLTINDGDDTEPLFVRGTRYIDQIQDLIRDLKANPDSRRLMVNAWNVAQLDQMVLPPCHYGFQVYTFTLSESQRLAWYKRKMDGFYHDRISQEMDAVGVPTRGISLMWNQRSVDTFLGLPFNIASYGLLLEILAKEVRMIPYELIGNLGDTHLYLNHLYQAKEQIGREPYELPTILFKDHLDDHDSIIDILRPVDFVLDNYQCHPAIKAPLSN